MSTITRSVAFASIIGSFALVACDDPNAPGPNTRTPTATDRAVDRTTDTTRGDATRGDTNRGVTSGDTTATDQSNASEHIDITARIRRAVMDDDDLSTTAKNCTIVTDSNGTVTLRGNVYSQAEKDAIASKAAAVVGVGNVVNQIVVNPN